MNKITKYKQVVEMVKKGCAAYGVTMRLANTTYVLNDGDSCLGYFDSGARTLNVAMRNHPFIAVSTLLHEYSHMQQWAEFKRGVKSKGAIIWMMEDCISQGTRTAAMNRMELELDAERRTVKLLKRWGIGTTKDMERYIKSAALYIWAHHVLYDKQSWFKRSVCLFNECSKAWVYLPSTLRSSFSKPPPKALYNAIVEMLE